MNNYYLSGLTIYFVFIDSLAEVFLNLFFVAPQLQTRQGMRLRRSANKSKNPLSGGGHSFLTGC